MLACNQGHILAASKTPFAVCFVRFRPGICCERGVDSDSVLVRQPAGRHTEACTNSVRHQPRLICLCCMCLPQRGGTSVALQVLVDAQTCAKRCVDTLRSLTTSLPVRGIGSCTRDTQERLVSCELSVLVARLCRAQFCGERA